MVSIGKILGLLILFSLFLIVTPKNYDFQVTYECHNNEYKWFESKLKNETVYGCKNWVQKILIKQQKNEYVRFESAMKEQQEKAEQEQEKDFEQEQKRQEEQQKLLQYQQEEEMLQQIEQMEKQIEEQRQKQREFQKQGYNKQNIEASTNVRNKQSQQNTETKVSSQTTNEKQKLTHRLTPLKNRKLIQNRNDQHLTHRLANIFHNLVSPHNRHQLKSSYDSEEHQNQIRHYFQLRHTEQQQQGEEEKFKPIKLHRSHPVEDVMFLLELIQMNSLILESTYPLHEQDIPSLQQLEKRHPKPVLPQGNTSTQQKQHFQAIKSPQYLRTNN